MWDATNNPNGNGFVASDGTTTIEFARYSDAETYARIRNRGVSHDKAMLTVTNYNKQRRAGSRRRSDKHAALRSLNMKRTKYGWE